MHSSQELVLVALEGPVFVQHFRNVGPGRGNELLLLGARPVGRRARPAGGPELREELRAGGAVQCATVFPDFCEALDPDWVLDTQDGRVWRRGPGERWRAAASSDAGEVTVRRVAFASRAAAWDARKARSTVRCIMVDDVAAEHALKIEQHRLL